MAKSRSPILGYNHNVRYRGLVFHVQTEDSGVTNPHVFSHLFHGGVILSTRKLVYDASASDETVKSLMQSQHKAVLRDLKKGSFDDKMDQYLGGTPGLLPRGQGVDGELPAADTPPAGAPMAQVAAEPATPPPLLEPEPTIPTPAPHHIVAPELPAHVSPRTLTPQVPGPASIAIPAPGRITGRQQAVSLDTIESRAPTERFSGDTTVPLARGSNNVASRQAMTPPPLTTKERGVSAAFDAIMLADEGRGGLAEVPGEDGAVEIRSEAPGSAPLPPGAVPERPGSYAQHRKSGGIAPLERGHSPTEPPPMASRDSQPPPLPAAARRATPTSGTPAMARPGTGPVPRAGTGPVPTRPSRPSPAPALPSYPSGKPTSTPPPQQRAQTQARTRSPSGGGVVVTRPAVIIGAPARTVGGGAPQPPPTAPSQQPPQTPRTTTQRVRKAREESDSGLFGQDLISEKSLDEVILAYLSEDPADE